MTHRTQILVVTFFMMILTIPAVSILLPVAGEEIENRRLAAPDFSADRILDPGFYREMANYIGDANPVRGLMIRAATELDYTLLGDSPNPSRVLTGTDGWLYDRTSIDSICAIDPDAVSRNLVDVVETIRSAGVRVIFTVAPAKVGFSPGHLSSPESDFVKCAVESSEKLRARLADAGDQGYVDSWQALSRIGVTADHVYFKTDTHFNHEAAMAWIEAMVTALEPGLWDQSFVTDAGTVEFSGNLATVAGLTVTESVREVYVDRGKSTQPVQQMHERFSDVSYATEVFRSASSGAPVLSGKVLVLKDSFMDIPMRSLVQYLGEVEFTDWRGEDSMAHFIDSLSEADVVIIETAEDQLGNRFGDGELLGSIRSRVGPSDPTTDQGS